MPRLVDLNKTPRRELTIFYVLDTSGSMKGTPIGRLNRAMDETTKIIRDMAKRNADALLKIAVLEFNSNSRWLQPAGPEKMEDFFWEDLKEGGLTDIGDALKELDSKLSKDQFLSSSVGAYRPIVIFMTDGYATDDYKKALDKIRKNKYFHYAVKIGFAVGDDADVQMIAELVGTAESVVQTDDWELFAKLLKFASMTASMAASKSHTPDDILTGETVLKQVAEEHDINLEEIQPKNIDDIEIIPASPFNFEDGGSFGEDNDY